jgi:hypothetical protein
VPLETFDLRDTADATARPSFKKLFFNLPWGWLVFGRCCFEIYKMSSWSELLLED